MVVEWVDFLCDVDDNAPLGLPLNIKDDLGYAFRLDSRAKNTLNSLLDTQFKGVYREATKYHQQWSSKGGLDLSGETVYIVTSKWTVICFTNSEWASLSREGK